MSLGNFNCLAHSETISVCALLTLTRGSTVAGSPTQLDGEHLDPPKRDAPARPGLSCSQNSSMAEAAGLSLTEPFAVHGDQLIMSQDGRGEGRGMHQAGWAFPPQT